MEDGLDESLSALSREDLIDLVKRVSNASDACHELVKMQLMRTMSPALSSSVKKESVKKRRSQSNLIYLVIISVM